MFEYLQWLTHTHTFCWWLGWWCQRCGWWWWWFWWFWRFPQTMFWLQTCILPFVALRSSWQHVEVVWNNSIHYDIHTPTLLDISTCQLHHISENDASIISLVFEGGAKSNRWIPRWSLQIHNEPASCFQWFNGSMPKYLPNTFLIMCNGRSSSIPYLKYIESWRNNHGCAHRCMYTGVHLASYTSYLYGSHTQKGKARGWSMMNNYITQLPFPHRCSQSVKNCLRYFLNQNDQDVLGGFNY